jgi:hypothetical protein
MPGVNVKRGEFGQPRGEVFVDAVGSEQLGAGPVQNAGDKPLRIARKLRVNEIDNAAVL